MQALAQHRDGSTLTRAANDDCIFSGPRTRTKYTYDGNGNRKTRTAGTYPAQSFTYVQGTNRDASTAYDGMGNSLKNLATYDASGRLDSLTDAQNMIHTSYNGQGELARTVVGFFDLCTNTWVTTAVDDLVFTPDGRALTIRTTSTSPVNVDYVWLDNLPVAQIQDSFDSYGNPIATELTYLHSDHLGTPRVGTSQARTVTWRNQGDAFGIPQLSGAATVRLRFPGQVALGFQNQVYNYYRDYDPNLERYLESDPIGLDGGLNTYGYVGANPLGLIDPTGEAGVPTKVPGTNSTVRIDNPHVPGLMCQASNSTRTSKPRVVRRLPSTRMALLVTVLIFEISHAIRSCCNSWPVAGSRSWPWAIC